MKFIYVVISVLYFFNVLIAHNVFCINMNKVIDIRDIKNDNYELFDSTISKKNIIGIDVSQLFIFSVGLSYERFFGGQNLFSIRIPLSVGLNYFINQGNISRIYVYENSILRNLEPNIFQNGKILCGALEFNYYPFNMKKVTYYAGPYLEFGKFAYRVHNFLNYNYGANFDPIGYIRNDGLHFAGGIQNGFLINLDKYFTFQGSIAIGLVKDEMFILDDRILTHIRYNLTFGIKL